MEPFVAMIAKIGGLAAIGGFIDFLMTRSEKKRLKDRLIEWWVIFDDVKWSNFGPAEAEYATRILEQLAGNRLLSKKRLRCTVVVSLSAYLLAIAWTAVRVLWVESGSGVNIGAGFQALTKHWTNLFALKWWALLLLVAFSCAVSLSVTNLIARTAARMSNNVPTAILTYVVILVAHAILLFLWNNLILNVALRSLQVLVDMLLNGTFNFAEYLMFVFRSLRLASWGFQIAGAWSALVEIRPLLLGTEDVVFYSFKAIMDLVANGVRIAFALIFLSSFVFGPLIKAPISRVWAAIVESEKPIFALVFGGIGTIGAGVSAYW